MGLEILIISALLWGYIHYIERTQKESVIDPLNNPKIRKTIKTITATIVVSHVIVISIAIVKLISIVITRIG